MFTSNYCCFLMKVEIIKASEKHLYSLKVLLKTFFPYSTQTNKIKINLKNGHQYYLLKVDGKTVGFLHFKESKIFYRLNGIAVDFSLRGKGYGKKLTKFLLNLAKKRKKNVNLLVDSGNIIALKLYYSLGFKKTRVSKRRLNGSTLLLLKWTQND